MRHDPFYCVFLKSPYYSIKDVFGSHAGCFGRAIVADHFNTASKIAQINAPLLVIHGQGDTLIPIDHGRRLVGLCKDHQCIKLDERPRINHTTYNILKDIIEPIQLFFVESSLDSDAKGDFSDLFSG